MALVTDLTARRLDAVLAAEQRGGRIPSVVAALTRDGSLVWRGSRGDATGEPGIRPADLQYRIGSITKTMTAVLVMQLRDAGRVSLGEPVSAYLPEVGGAVGDRTLRDLLAHGAGISAEPPGEWWERVEGGSFEKLLAGLSSLPAVFDPGAVHHYSNVGYAVLGEVVARVDGRPWWESVSERLLQPLGMTRTSYDPFDPHAQGYSVAPWAPVLTSEPATDTGAMAPAGQVWSTVMDLATYADFLITGHRDVLPLSTLEEMSTVQTGAMRGGLSSGYGLGLRLLPGGSGGLIGHTGSMPGFQAVLFVDRVRRTGAVVLANSTTGLRTEQVAGKLLDTLEEWEPAVPDAWEPVDEVPDEVSELLGVWHWGNTPKLFTWDGQHLEVQDPLTGERRELFALVTPGPDDAERPPGLAGPPGPAGPAGPAAGFVGVTGYHHGEPLEVVRRPDGRISHLVCSTFVYTRVPYDPFAPIPGGPP